MPAAPRGYLALLRLPSAASLTLWAALARLQYGVLPLVTLLLLADVRDSYAEAGAATAAVGLTAGLLGPLRARAADRFGHGRVLVVAAVAYALGIGLLLLLATAPLPLLVAAALLAGCLPPPVGPVMRAAWRDITRDEPESLRAAFSLDSVAEEVLYVVGPLIAAVAVARLAPGPVLIASSLLLLLACLGMAVVLRTLRDAVGDAVAVRPRVPWRSARFLLGLLPATAVGLLLGGLELAAVAAVLRLAGAELAGVPAALIAIGSIGGGLLYGRRLWPGGVRRQAVVLVLGSASAVLVAAAVSGWLVPMLLAFLVAGVFVAPAVVASYVIADDAVTGSSAEATSWVNSAFNVGTAFGTALAGVLVDAGGPGAAMLALAVTTVALTAVAVAAARPRGRLMKA
ncbi:MFS transporter [Longivirga aurantiaca]|uniref:MFS transporter n=1 Tax=Longivirga aurantiaca TaxID=1837743 RepID=A0ABW1SX78_9ACTN